MRKTIWLDLVIHCYVELKQAYYKQNVILLYAYKETAKHAHRLYYVITVDYNLKK